MYNFVPFGGEEEILKKIKNDLFPVFKELFNEDFKESEFKMKFIS